MQEYLSGRPESMAQCTKIKINNIEKNRKDKYTYVETNHTFIKGFGWFIPEYFDEKDIGVIILKRNKHDVAKSFQRINALPTNKLGRDFIISPDLDDRIIPPPEILFSPKFTCNTVRFIRQFFRGSAYYRKAHLPTPKIPKWITKYERECLEWYVDETFALSNKYVNKFKNINYYTIENDKLNSIEEISKMMTFFNLKCSPEIDKIIGSPTNKKL
jgi:hypothetical protein